MLRPPPKPKHYQDTFKYYLLEFTQFKCCGTTAAFVCVLVCARVCGYKSHLQVSQSSTQSGEGVGPVCGAGKFH